MNDLKNEAKEYLNQIRYIDLDINSRQEELTMLRASFLGAQELKHDKISSNNGNSQENKLIKYVELSSKIDETIDNLYSMKIEIGQQIDQLNDKKQILVLRERYILGKSWKEISYTLDCSERTVYRLHGEALKSFNDIVLSE